ncbi:speedy protein E4-like [Fukomys damarensis]|uniref:speedy protein E4-like n=1 Tax=Fukomys damarensis TaxID=885580 RepID=UPI00053FE4EE|nr:speedy protein E4-like [Fukomys damarensis]
MATSQPSSPCEDQSSQSVSPAGGDDGYALQVVMVDDEIPGQSGPWVAPSLLPQACVQKRKKDWSSESEEELQDNLLGLADGVPGLAPLLPLSHSQKKHKVSEAEQERNHQQGASDSSLRGNPSLLPRSSGHQWKREWLLHPKEDKEGRVPRCFDLAPREEIRLPPRKRWREYLSMLQEASQETSGQWSPVPSTHMGVVEKPHGLKRKMKRKHMSSVLPEHHEAFTRLIEDPVIMGFLAWDKNLRASDKNLLAMVIAYFSRAGLFSWQYQRVHFFLALYLASDMEEDNRFPKLHMFFFLYGTNFDKIPRFHKLRHQFIHCMDWNLRVTREECEEIQAYDPTLWVWGRDRTLTLGP